MVHCNTDIRSMSRLNTPAVRPVVDIRVCNMVRDWLGYIPAVLNVRLCEFLKMRQSEVDIHGAVFAGHHRRLVDHALDCYADSTRNDLAPHRLWDMEREMPSLGPPRQPWFYVAESHRNVADNAAEYGGIVDIAPRSVRRWSMESVLFGDDQVDAGDRHYEDEDAISYEPPAANGVPRGLRRESMVETGFGDDQVDMGDRHYEDEDTIAYEPPAAAGAVDHGGAIEFNEMYFDSHITPSFHAADAAAIYFNSDTYNPFMDMRQGDLEHDCGDNAPFHMAGV